VNKLEKLCHSGIDFTISCDAGDWSFTLYGENQLESTQNFLTTYDNCVNSLWEDAKKWEPEKDCFNEGVKESISDKCSKPPIFEFEGFFIIRPFDGFHLWMENSHGEGTQIRKSEFLAALSKLFKDNF